MKRTAGDFRFLVSGASVLDVTVLHQFFLDLNEIFFLQRDIKRSTDRFQMIDFPFRFQGLFRQGLVRPLQFVVFIKKLLRIFPGRQLVIQRDSDFLVRIVVQAGELFLAALQLIAVRVEQFTVDLVFVTFFRIL